MRGPLFWSSQAAIGQNHGVFAVSQPPPTTIVPTGTGVVAVVGQMSWGPSSGDPDNVHQCTGTQDWLNTFHPLGMNRLTSAYLMALRGSWPLLFACRVNGTNPTRATCALGAPITLTALWVGTQGNNITATVGAASDGNANHWNLTVSVSNASGTTSETFANINTSNVGAIALPSLGAPNSILLGAIGINNNTRPTNGSYTFSGASDGSAVTSANYTGTQGGGSPNQGFALLEGFDVIRHVWVDDPGAVLRPAVNAGMLAHVNFLQDRVGYISGPSGQSPTQVQSDVLNYVSQNIVYTDPWVYIFDDTSGAKQLIPANWAGASLGANASPSTSFAWRNLILRQYLSGIVGLETNRGVTKSLNTALGISTLIPFKGGGFCFEAAKVTAAASNQAQANWTRTMMGIYIATAVEDSLMSNVDAPNVLLNQQEIMAAMDAFLFDLKKNQLKNPNTSPYIADYSLQTIGNANTPTSISQGNFIIAAAVKIGSSMERIIFSVTYGETVTITPVGSTTGN